MWDKLIAWLLSEIDVGTKKGDAPTITIPVDIFIKNMVEKRSFLQVQNKKWKKRLSKAIEAKKTKEKRGLQPDDGILDEMMSYTTDIKEGKRTNVGEYSILISSNDSIVCPYERFNQSRSSRRNWSFKQYRFASLEEPRWTISVFGPIILIVVNWYFGSAMKPWSYLLIYTAQH